MTQVITANQNIANYATQGIPQDDHDVDILDLLLMLWRRRMLIIAIILGGIGLAVIGLHFIVPQYKAQGVVLIEDPAGNLGGLKASLGGGFLGSLSGGDASIASDIEILRSRSFIADILGRLDHFSQPGGFAEKSRDAFKSLSINAHRFQLLPPEAIDPEMAEAITQFSESLNIRALPGSPAFQIEFIDPNPQHAAHVVHTIMETYLAERAEKMTAENKRLRAWLDERMGELKAQLREKQQGLTQALEESGGMQTPGSLAGAEEIGALYEQLIQAKAEKSAIEARMEYLENVRIGRAVLEAAPEVLRSEIVSRLRLQAVTLEGKVSELSERYGERHPRMINARAELTDLNRSIQQEMQKSAQTAKAELNLITSKIVALEESLNDVKAEAFEGSDNSLKMLELERESDLIKSAIEGLVRAYALADQQALLGESKARVISHPAIPSKPYSPNQNLLIGLSLIVSLFVAFIVVLFIEKIDKRFRSSSQLEALTGLKCIGLLPFIKISDLAARALHPLQHPQGSLASALQDLRMELKLKKMDTLHTPKVIAMTSSHPGEGKTTLSVWLARLSAKAGERVIVIDTDLRRPNVHKTLQHSNDLSLVDYLMGKASLSEIIHKDEPSGAHFIFARAAASSIVDLMNSDKMRDLIEELRSEYDLVLLDTPAALAASDAKLISGFADLMLYIVSWRKTTADTLLRGIKRFVKDTHSLNTDTPISLILSHIDARRFVRYGYGHVIYN